MILNNNAIGKRVKEVRGIKHLSQAELAECINMSVTYISHIETAKKRASLEALVRISNALDVTIDQLLYGNQTNDSSEYRLDLIQLLDDCSSYEKHVIYEVALATKKSLRENGWLQRKTNQF